MRERGLEKRDEPRPESPLLKVICGNPKLRGSTLPDTRTRLVSIPIDVFGLPNNKRSWARKFSWKRLKPKRPSLTALLETTLTRLIETRWTSVGVNVFV